MGVALPNHMLSVSFSTFKISGMIIVYDRHINLVLYLLTICLTTLSEFLSTIQEIMVLPIACLYTMQNMYYYTLDFSISGIKRNSHGTEQ